MSYSCLSNSPIHRGRSAQSKRDQQVIAPLLKARDALSPEKADAFYQAATDQTPGDKLALLKQALQFGQVEAGRVLINFARPRNVHSAGTPEQIDFWRYLIANSLLGDNGAKEELKRILNQSNKKQMLYSLQDILTPYHDLAYDVSVMDEQINLQLLNAGSSFSDFRQSRQRFNLHEVLAPEVPTNN